MTWAKNGEDGGTADDGSRREGSFQSMRRGSRTSGQIDNGRLQIPIHSPTVAYRALVVPLPGLAFMYQTLTPRYPNINTWFLSSVYSL